MDGDYSITVTVGGSAVDCGALVIADGRGAASVSMFTVSFFSDGTLLQKAVVCYGHSVTPPVPEKGGYTFNGWYEGSTIFTSRSLVTGTMELDVLWGEDIPAHRNVTGDNLPVQITSETEDVSVFFDECSVNVFITAEDLGAADGTLDIAYSLSSGIHSFSVKVNGSGARVMKSITLPYDVMRPGAHIESMDGSQVGKTVFDAASQTVTFISDGEQFSVGYDADPAPYDGNELNALVIIAGVLLCATVASAVFLAVLARRR